MVCGLLVLVHVAHLGEFELEFLLRLLIGEDGVFHLAQTLDGGVRVFGEFLLGLTEALIEGVVSLGEVVEFRLLAIEGSVGAIERRRPGVDDGLLFRNAEVQRLLLAIEGIESAAHLVVHCQGFGVLGGDDGHARSRSLGLG